MLTAAEIDDARRRAGGVLDAAGIVLTRQEQESIEIADFGLSRFYELGLVLAVYVNTARVCAKELVLFPRQTCPEHRHPPFDGNPGKEETFRCRQGLAYLYIEGDAAPTPAARLPVGEQGNFTVWHEILLAPGEQHTIAPNTLHWFQAGDDGAIVTEFATTNRDDLDVFTDAKIRRATVVAPG